MIIIANGCSHTAGAEIDFEMQGQCYEKAWPHHLSITLLVILLIFHFLVHQLTELLEQLLSISSKNNQSLTLIQNNTLL